MADTQAHVVAFPQSQASVTWGGLPGQGTFVVSDASGNVEGRLVNCLIKNPSVQGTALGPRMCAGLAGRALLPWDLQWEWGRWILCNQALPTPGGSETSKQTGKVR